MASTGSALGTVLRWDDDRRGAILDAEECPGGCWADASVVVHSTQGGGRLRAGQVVRFDWAADPEGEWPFRASRVEPGKTCRPRWVVEEDAVRAAWRGRTTRPRDYCA